jgi:AcrR family transcriptional regulator
MSDIVERPMRADARRNREQVLAAAVAVFSESGLKAQVDEVARRAGVGVGTVCRHFSTKQVLVDATLQRMFGSLVKNAHDALDQDDPGAAFRTFVVALSDFQARHRGLAEQMATEIDESAEVRPLRAELRDAVNELLARAQAAGAIRADIGPADIAMLFSGVAHATALAGDLEAQLRQRYVAIILDGMRPLDTSELPGRPMDFVELQRLKARRAK